MRLFQVQLWGRNCSRLFECNFNPQEYSKRVDGNIMQGVPLLTTLKYDKLYFILTNGQLFSCNYKCLHLNSRIVCTLFSSFFKHSFWIKCILNPYFIQMKRLWREVQKSNLSFMCHEIFDINRRLKTVTNHRSIQHTEKTIYPTFIPRCFIFTEKLSSWIASVKSCNESTSSDWSHS